MNTMAEVANAPTKRASSDGPSKRSSEDKWVSAYRHNSNRSLLMSRLPEELLLKIMAFLSNLDVYMLRHASRTFMRLFEDKRFDYFRSNKCEHWSIRDIWSRPNLDDCLTEKEQDKLANKVWNSRLLYCKRCVKFRDRELDYRMAEMRSQVWDCAECEEPHQAPLFSSTQRQLPGSLRRCIGREGVVRICAHNQLSWSDVELWFEMDCDLEEDDSRVVCQHESHDPLISAQSRFSSPITLDPKYIAGMRPALEIRNGVGEARLVDTVFKIKWSTLVAEIGEEQHVTFQQLSDGLKRFGEVSTNYLCPHFSFDDIQLLLPFDPNRCACLGAEIPISHMHVDEKTTEARERSCCLCYAAMHNTTGSFLPADGANHGTHCQYCDACFTWKRVERYIILEGSKELQVLTPTDIEWLSELDPKSYGLTRDKSSRYISWCPDKNCSTTRRYAKQFRELQHYSDPRCCGVSCTHGYALARAGYEDREEFCQTM